LAESQKDRAENVMIVDLLRNDLSRVCRPGTVRVPELFALEHHPTVHHLVSTVVGELELAPTPAISFGRHFPRLDYRCPQVRAMEIIAELEPTQRECTAARGVYQHHRRHGYQHRHPNHLALRGRYTFRPAVGS